MAIPTAQALPHENNPGDVSFDIVKKDEQNGNMQIQDPTMSDKYNEIINSNKIGYLSSDYYKQNIIYNQSNDKFNLNNLLPTNDIESYTDPDNEKIDYIIDCGQRAYGGTDAKSHNTKVARSRGVKSPNNISSAGLSRISGSFQHNLTFEDWLTKKKQQAAERRAKLRLEEERYRSELAERRRLSAQKYDEWLHNKMRKATQLKSKSTSRAVSKSASFDSSSSTRMSQLQQRDEEVRQYMEEWERRKIDELERRRELKRQENRMKLNYEKKRRAMAHEAWKRWIAEVDGRTYYPNDNVSNESFYEVYANTEDYDWEPEPMDSEQEN